MCVRFARSPWRVEASGAHCLFYISLSTITLSRCGVLQTEASGVANEVTSSEVFWEGPAFDASRFHSSATSSTVDQTNRGRSRPFIPGDQ